MNREEFKCSPNVKMKGLKRGLPRLYSPAIVRAICKHIVEGKTTTAICKMPGMPTMWTVGQWLHKYPDFAEQYYRAKQIQTHLNIDNIKQVALDADGSSSASVMKATLVVNTMKWEAGKLLPKIFGERGNLDTTSKEEVNQDLLEDVMAKALQKVLSFNPAVGSTIDVPQRELPLD